MEWIMGKPRVHGRNLTRIRKDRGITQVELARELGLPQQTVSDYERGRLRLHDELLIKLAGILRVSTDELLGVKKPAATEPEVIRPFMRRLRNVHRLSRREQRALLTTIDAFLKKAS